MSHDEAAIIVATVLKNIAETYTGEEGKRRLRNPMLRKTLARRVTIAQACGMMDVDVEAATRAQRQPRRATGLDARGNNSMRQQRELPRLEGLRT